MQLLDVGANRSDIIQLVCRDKEPAVPGMISKNRGKTGSFVARRF